MKVQSVLEKNISLQEKIDIIQKVYDNCWNSETNLFNTMSQIVEICHEESPTSFNKIKEIKNLAVDALERTKQIGLTNPDLYGSELRRNSLAKQIKQARKNSQNTVLTGKQINYTILMRGTKC